MAATITVAGVVAAGAMDVEQPEPRPRLAADLRVDAASDRIALTHLRGDPVDVERLPVRVRIDGEPLTHQPPVPFFAAKGFHAGRTGPFNVAADPEWSPGETASVELASTTDPLLEAGATVIVTLVVDGWTVARLTATA